MAASDITATVEDVIAASTSMTAASIGGPGDDRYDALERILDACKARIDSYLRPWDDDPLLDPRLPAINQAAIMMAERIWARRDSPNGVAGFGGAGEVVRISRFDPDIEGLIDPWTSPGIA